MTIKSFVKHVCGQVFRNLLSVGFCRRKDLPTIKYTLRRKKDHWNLGSPQVRIELTSAKKAWKNRIILKEGFLPFILCIEETHPWCTYGKWRLVDMCCNEGTPPHAPVASSEPNNMLGWETFDIPMLGSANLLKGGDESDRPHFWRREELLEFF